MGSAIGFVQRNYQMVYPTAIPKRAGALRFGILGAANIGPLGLIMPAQTHEDVVVLAVAARSLAKAEAYAKKHGIPKVHGSYQELLDDPEIDVIYNPLPNGLHFEWTIKALLAGKHVLLEKPAANTAAETRQMFALAKERGLVLLEAFHYRFHPAIQRVKAILESGELGAVQSVRANMLTTKGIFTGDDIRFDYDLGGGAMMDMGCYALCVTRYLGGEPTEVLAASHVERGLRVDRATDVHLALASGATARLACDLEFPAALAGVVPRLPDWSVAATCEGGSVALTNFLMPVHWHSIVVTKADGTVRTEKAYTGAGKGEAWWSTYRYQLEAFVDRLRGREPQHWFTEEDSVQNMHWIEQIYAKGGYGSRPASTYVPNA